MTTQTSHRAVRTPSVSHLSRVLPVRLVDLLENHGMSRDVSKLDTLVFDEADQLLEMGFRPAIEQILRNLPGKVRRRFAFIGARQRAGLCTWGCL